MKIDRMVSGWMLALLPAVLLLAACQTAKGPPPTETAGEVAGLLLAGKTAEAETQFGLLEDADSRGLAYDVLYGQAKKLSAQRDYGSATRINRFLVKQFPDRLSAREALLYGLWLERAQAGRPQPEGTRREMENLALSIRRGGTAPVWTDLAMAQVAVDDGDITVARASMARFTSRWNGRPATLRGYVTEMERWIETHGGQ